MNKSQEIQKSKSSDTLPIKSKTYIIHNPNDGTWRYTISLLKVGDVITSQPFSSSEALEEDLKLKFGEFWKHTISNFKDYLINKKKQL